jgi:hypothetical protein
MTEGREVIIPIWWKVKLEDVKKLSPLLVDPNAITVGSPEKIAEEIKIATSTAMQERKRWDRKLQLAESIRLKKAANSAYARLSRTREGSEMFYQEWKFVEDRCRIPLEECGLTNETAIESKDTLFLRILSIAHSGLTFGRFNTLVLRFDLEGLGNGNCGRIDAPVR